MNAKTMTIDNVEDDNDNNKNNNDDDDEKSKKENDSLDASARVRC